MGEKAKKPLVDTVSVESGGKALIAQTIVGDVILQGVIAASSSGLDWRPYLTSLVNRYDANENFKHFITLRKYDRVVGTGKELKKLGVLDLDQYVNSWLATKHEPHLAILGGYGSGKTWYSHWLTYRLAKARLSNPATEIVPVLIPLRSFSEASDVSTVLEMFWDHTGRGDFTLFKQAVFQGEVLVILDGFDEMSTDFREQVRSANFSRLRRFFAHSSKVILTSRINYFASSTDEGMVLSQPRLGSMNTGLIPSPEGSKMAVVYLDNFSPADIKAYLISRLGVPEGERSFQHITTVYDLVELAETPILTNIMVATWPTFVGNDVKAAASLYGIYAQQWLERESWRLPDVNLVKRFIQRLAIDLQLNERSTISEVDFSAALRDYLEPFTTEHDLIQDTERRIKNCTFLFRDGSKDWSFIHRSFMEFFCAQKCYEDFTAGTVDFTDSFPLNDRQIGILNDFCNVLLKTKRLPQARWAVASQSSQVTDFFADMLITENMVNDFGNFLIRSRLTVWGYKLFEEDRLENLVDPKIRERLESDFEWDYYLQNEDWFDLKRPKSPNRLKYADKP